MHMSHKLKIAIVIPAYNEKKTIFSTIKSAKKIVKNVIVVDDGSLDETSELARKAGAIVLTQPVNMGVGFATRLGTEYAINSLKAGIIITLDADGQHPVSAIKKLLECISQGNDAAFAVRTEKKAAMPLLKRVGNLFLTNSLNFLYSTSFSDTQTGFKAFTAKAYEKLNLSENGYAFCSEFAVETALKKLKYCEVPIEPIYDSWTKIKGTDIVTGIRIFLKTLFWKVSKWLNLKN